MGVEKGELCKMLRFVLQKYEREIIARRLHHIALEEGREYEQMDTALGLRVAAQLTDAAIDELADALITRGTNDNGNDGTASTKLGE